MSVRICINSGNKVSSSGSELYSYRKHLSIFFIVMVLQFD